MHLDSKDCTISPSQRNDYSTLRVNLFSSEMRSPHLVFLVGVLFCAVVNGDYLHFLIYSLICIFLLLLGQHPHCPDVYGLATHPHPEFCDKFFKCENGTLTLETCENGLLFDGKSGVHNHCGYNWGVQCGEGRVSDGEVKRDFVVLNFVLNFWRANFHVFWHANFCANFCANFWHAKISANFCAKKISTQKFQCQKPLKNFPKLVPAISTPGCLYQFGIYPKAPGCHKTYVKCAFGVPYETHCEAGLAYDEKTHSCNWPDLLLENGCDPEGEELFNKSVSIEMIQISMEI